MAKMLLLSLLVANVALPMMFAGDPDPRRGVRRTIGSIVGFNVLYLFALIYIYPLLAE